MKTPFTIHVNPRCGALLTSVLCLGLLVAGCTTSTKGEKSKEAQAAKEASQKKKEEATKNAAQAEKILSQAKASAAAKSAAYFAASAKATAEEAQTGAVSQQTQQTLQAAQAAKGAAETEQTNAEAAAKNAREALETSGGKSKTGKANPDAAIAATAVKEAKEAEAAANKVVQDKRAVVDQMQADALKAKDAGLPTADAMRKQANDAQDALTRATAKAVAVTNSSKLALEMAAKAGGESESRSNQPPVLQIPLFLLSGAKFQNPYIIAIDNTVPGAKGTIQKSGNGTVGFLEFAYIGRYALVGDESFKPPNANFLGGQFLWPWNTAPDLDGRIGFVFGNNLAPTNYSASTIAGGGDFYASLSVGFPFWRAESEFTRRQLNIEFSGGASTDKDFLQVHTTVFTGLSYELGYRLSPDAKFPGVFAFRAGMAVIDNPSISATSSNLLVNVDGGLPLFDHQWVPAFGVYLAHPLIGGLYLTTSANIYSFREVYGGHAGPDQWNVAIGVSMPFDALLGMFAKSSSPTKTGSQ